MIFLFNQVNSSPNSHSYLNSIKDAAIGSAILGGVGQVAYDTFQASRAGLKLDKQMAKGMAKNSFKNAGICLAIGSVLTALINLPAQIKNKKSNNSNKKVI